MTPSQQTALLNLLAELQEFKVQAIAQLQLVNAAIQQEPEYKVNTGIGEMAVAILKRLRANQKPE